jgi:hypothetical protein
MPGLTAKQEAQEEVKQEKFNADKEEYKMKLVQLAGAVKIVANFRREIEDLDARIQESS